MSSFPNPKDHAFIPANSAGERCKYCMYHKRAHTTIEDQPKEITTDQEIKGEPDASGK